MKKQLCFLMLVFMAINAFGQWRASNLTSVTYLPIVMENHNGTMYATVANGFTATLNKLNPDNTSWTAIPTSSDIVVPRFLQSAGSRLYMSTVISSSFSVLYYSKDNAATFVADTVGLPHFSTGVSLIYGIQYHNGKVFVAMAGNGYYMKDTAATTWQAVNTPTGLNAPSDPLTFFKDTLYVFDNAGAQLLYTSTDYGLTWTVRPGNLPADFSTRVLTADDVTGRLYTAGSWSTATVYGLKYSDDGGRTWTTSPEAGAFMGKNYNHTQQQVTALYAHNNMLYMALENNNNSSAADIVGSLTGPAGLAYDTVGLPTNAGGTTNGVKFQLYQGKLSLNMNVTDVYLKDVANAVHDVHAPEAALTLYPNPCKERLSIKLNSAATELRITDYTGRIVWTAPADTKEADLSALRPGMYLIQAVKDNMVTGVQKFVKE